jgi:LmbE family N-acetylglucosaminyl deacetylase
MAENPEFLKARNILVVAPHPDDESLGCGGLIAKLAAHGRHFHTIFVTDGGASHLRSLRWSRQRLAARRQREAEDALHRLGIGDHPRTFLRLRDADMPARSSLEWKASVEEVATILRTFEAGLVLLPWRRDPHCDHRNSWQLIMDALGRARLKPTTLEYAIWLDELGLSEDRPRDDEAERVVVDVSSEMEKKQAAIAAHLSQTTDLIDDDPSGFRLTAATICRLVGPRETYWRAWR